MAYKIPNTEEVSQSLEVRYDAICVYQCHFALAQCTQGVNCKVIS